MSDKSTQSEQAAELLRLVDQIRDWSDQHLRKKNPVRHGWLTMQINALRKIAEKTPEQAGAALLGAKVVWDMVFEDARRGARQRNIQGFSLPRELETEDILISKIDAHHEENPDKSITWLREKVANETGYSGAKTIARKTDWYNPKK